MFNIEVQKKKHPKPTIFDSNIIQQYFFFDVIFTEEWGNCSMLWKYKTHLNYLRGKGIYRLYMHLAVNKELFVLISF